MEKKLIVAFHVGRGGRFFNPGHKTFNGHVKRLSDCYEHNAFIHREDFNGNPLPDEEWILDNGSGRALLTGRDAIESPVGVLDWDGDYDTDIVKYIEDCDEVELELVYQAYLMDDAWMENELKEYICRHKGMKRIKDIDFAFSEEATIRLTDGSEITYTWDGEHDVTEDEIREWMHEQNIDPLSIEQNADRFEDYFHIED